MGLGMWCNLFPPWYVLYVCVCVQTRGAPYRVKSETRQHKDTRTHTHTLTHTHTRASDLQPILDEIYNADIHHAGPVMSEGGENDTQFAHTVYVRAFSRRILSVWVCVVCLSKKRLWCIRRSMCVLCFRVSLCAFSTSREITVLYVMYTKHAWQQSLRVFFTKWVSWLEMAHIRRPRDCAHSPKFCHEFVSKKLAWNGQCWSIDR